MANQHGVFRMRNAIWHESEVSTMEPSQKKLRIWPGSLVKRLIAFIKDHDVLMLWGNAIALKPAMGALRSGKNHVQPELAIDLIKIRLKTFFLKKILR